MTTREMATRNLQIRNLKVHEVRTLMDIGKATDNEIMGFIRFCQGADANPYMKEAYLIKYDAAKPATIVLAIQWYVKRAASHPSYLGFQAGVLVRREGKIYEHTGAVVYPGEDLFGGWCRIFVKDIQQPYEQAVMLSEYDRRQAMWVTHPATMIENTAIRQTMRRAFPDFYEAEDGAELPVAIEGEYTEVPSHTPHSGQEGEKVNDSGDTPRPPTPLAPIERRFHNVNEFWAAVEKAGWTRDQVADALGGSLGQWLNLRMKEQGKMPTWDDAFQFLMEKLRVAEGA